MKASRAGFAAVLSVFVILAATGCGSDDDSESTSAGDSASAPEVDLDALYAGSYEDPPSSAPEPEPGMKVFLLSCGQSIPFCASAIAGAEEAAESLGWDSTIVDSKGDPTIMAQGIRQAIAAGADGIFIEAFDCDYIKQPLEEAKDAGIPVTAAESRDCNQSLSFKETNGPQLFASVVSYAEGPLVDWLRAIGNYQAQYMLSKTGDDLNAASFYFSDIAVSEQVTVGFDEEIASCESCESKNITFTLAEAGAGLQEKAEQALITTPGVNAVRVDSDGTLTGGVLSAVNSSGTDALIMAVEGQEAVLDLVREGNTDIAGTGIPTAWEGYAGIDGLIRAMAGEPAEGSGLGLQMWDADHNLPPSGPYEAPIDFRAKYKQAWGVE